MFFWRRRHPIGDEELSAYVDGRLEAAARARLEAHNEACAACREALAELGALRRALREMPRAAAPRSFALREADVRPVTTAQPVGALGRAPAVLGGVAMAAFLAFGVLVGVDVVSEPSDRDAQSALRYAGPLSEGAADEQVAGLAPATPDAVLRGESYAADDVAEEVMDGAMEAEGEPAEGLSAASPAAVPTAIISPTPAARDLPQAEDDARTGLRAAEAATAAVALVAGGSLALVWWRRRP